MPKPRYHVRWFDLKSDALVAEDTFPPHFFVEACIAANTRYPRCWATLYDCKMKRFREIDTFKIDIMQDNIDAVRAGSIK
jgi:hypothetical protein